AAWSVVTLQAQDGRRALLAFTGLDALRGWRADARPVPVTVDQAAQTARNEDLAAVLIDVSGPHALVIEGEVLQELAAGHRLVELSDGEFGWVTGVLPGEYLIQAVRFHTGPDAVLCS